MTTIFTADVNGDTITASTLGAIIGQLPGMSGYIDIPDGGDGDDQALQARYQHAVHVATVQQAVLAGKASTEGWDPAGESDDEIAALFSDRLIPVALDGEWNHPVPLILIATDYAPFTEVPVPAGNVVLIDPSDERSYLDSLERVGLVTLHVDDDTDEADD